MDDATQKLVDEARAGYPFNGSLIARLADALESERGHIQSLAKWVGVDEATSSLEIACEASAALEAAQRPPVSPEAREAVTITEAHARVLRNHLRSAWASGDCTAALDDAMRALDEQITNLDRRGRAKANE